MDTMPPPSDGPFPTPEPTPSGLVAAYLLIPATLLVLWAASEPLLAAAIATLVAGVTVVVAGAVRGLGSRGPGGRRRICVPHTGVCVEL